MLLIIFKLIITSHPVSNTQTYHEADVEIVVDGEVSLHFAANLDGIASLEVDEDRVGCDVYVDEQVRLLPRADR